MTIPSFLIRFNAARPAVDGRGVFTKEIADALTRLFEAYNGSTGVINADIAALEAVPYITSAASSTTSAERVTTDTATVSWDHATAGQAKANVVDGSITTTKLGGDITTAGKALLDDIDAAAQLTTLGVSAFIQTLLNDVDAATARATLVAMASTTTLDAIPVATSSVNFNNQQATNFRIENRTSDPASPSVGQIWLRTDL